jgi:hypothetical protein
MWRMSNATALIFIAAVAIAVALLLLLLLLARAIAQTCTPPGLRSRFAVTVIPRFMAAIRRDYATARTCNGRTYPNRGLCQQQRRCSGPALCSEEHRTW